MSNTKKNSASRGTAGSTKTKKRRSKKKSVKSLDTSLGKNSLSSATKSASKTGSKSIDDGLRMAYEAIYKNTLSKEQSEKAKLDQQRFDNNRLSIDCASHRITW